MLEKRKSEKITYTVLIPAYNAGNVITKTLDSVINQSLKSFEIIIIDDGSKDNTYETVNKYKKEHGEYKIRYYWQENGGASSARYRGCKEAIGDYVAFLDADDYWYPNKLERVEHYIYTYNADIYYHDEIEVWKDGTRNAYPGRDLSKDPLSDLVIKGNAMATSATIVRRELLEKSDPFFDKKRAGEDYECWIRLALYGGKFFHIKETLGEYRRNEDGLTLINDKYLLETYEESLNYFEYLDCTRFSEQQIEVLKNKKRAFNSYCMARHYHRKRDYKKAIASYVDSMKQGNKDFRCFAGLILAKLKIYGVRK